MKFALAFIFMVLLQTSLVQAQTCQDLFAVQNSNVKQKLDLLRELSEDVSEFLFQNEAIENNPGAFADFLNHLEELDLEKLHGRQIDDLVGSYLKANLQTYTHAVERVKQQKANSPEQALIILQEVLSEQLKLQIRNRSELELKSSALRIHYQKNRNIFKATAAVAAWITVGLMSRSFIPIYLPKLNRFMSKAQKAELVQRLPVMTQAEAIQYINQRIPGGNGLRIYNGFQKIFWRLSLVAGLYMVAVSPAVLHSVDQYTPFGSDLIEVKDAVDSLWLKTFYSRTHLQNLAFEATLPFLNDPNDPHQRAELEAQIRKMSFDDLRERIP